MKQEIVCTNCGCWWRGIKPMPVDIRAYLEKRGWWFDFSEGQEVMICPECDKKLKRD